MNQWSRAYESLKNSWYIDKLPLRKVYLLTQHVVAWVAHRTHWPSETLDQSVINMSPYHWWIILFGLHISYEWGGSSPSTDKSFPYLACRKNKNIHLGKGSLHFNYDKCYINIWHYKSSYFSCWYFCVIFFFLSRVQTSPNFIFSLFFVVGVTVTHDAKDQVKVLNSKFLAPEILIC